MCVWHNCFFLAVVEGNGCMYIYIHKYLQSHLVDVWINTYKFGIHATWYTTIAPISTNIGQNRKLHVKDPSQIYLGIIKCPGCCNMKSITHSSPSLSFCTADRNMVSMSVELAGANEFYCINTHKRVRTSLKISYRSEKVKETLYPKHNYYWSFWKLK